MPLIDTKNFARNQGYAYGGKTMWFQEVEGGTRKLGRVVGYYYDMAQLLMEVPIAPVEYETDPTLPCFTLLVKELNPRARYCSIDVFLLDTNAMGLSSRYPHRCPRCQRPALIFFRTVECSSYGCSNYCP